MGFNFIHFLTGFIGGSFLVDIFAQPNSLYGTLFIGLIIGILYEGCGHIKEPKSEVEE